MRWRPCQGQKKTPAKSVEPEAPRTPPMPDNPYRRFYTRTPTFEELVHRARSHNKTDPEKK